ncbi:MAG: hypothetical protein PHE03_11680 [Bacteroidales bacterium]|nr:hypothetical protein [Bacteroidales bacterium]
MKIPLLIFRLHSAVCFSSAPLSKILSFFGLLQIATFAPAAGGWVLRIEEKRREEKRREEKRREGSNQWVEIFEVGFSRLLFPP